MGLTIDDDEAHALARELADLENTTLTDAVTRALREALEHRQESEQVTNQRVNAILNRMREQLAKSPGPSLHDISASIFDDKGLQDGRCAN